MPNPTKLDLSTQAKASGPVLIGNTNQAGMDSTYAPQPGFLCILNNCGSDNMVDDQPGGYGFTAWSLSTNPSTLDSIVGVYGIGEVILASGSFGNAAIGPQGAQLDGISRPGVGSTIASVKGAQLTVIHNGAGTTTFAIGCDVEGLQVQGGGTVTEGIGVRVIGPDVAITNYGIVLEGNYAGANDFAILVTSTTARSFFGVINFGGTVAIADTGISRLANGSLAIGNGTAGDASGKLTTAHLKATGLSVFANNAAAITGGLTAGDFYRTGADPDVVCVVH